MKRLEGKVAIVTGGGGSNIGRGIVKRFAEEGAHLVIADSDIAQAEASAAVVEKLGQKALVVQTDVRQTQDCQRLVEKAVKTFGEVDILVASAGIGYTAKPVLERPLEEWQHLLDINLTGLMLCNRFFAAYLVENKRSGAIINIASSATFIATAGGAHYRVAKAGVWMLTKTLALELGSHGIRVNAIAPGWMVTPEEYMSYQKDYQDEVEHTPLQRMGTPRDVGNVAVFLASEEASFITGEVICVDGGRYADSRS